VRRRGRRGAGDHVRSRGGRVRWWLSRTPMVSWSCLAVFIKFSG
jgi:hypothetical protein